MQEILPMEKSSSASHLPRAIELLAPAKDLETAIQAILHGADAVYIGAPKFGARASAGVSLEDLGVLCTFAHQYGVRIYVALNTILYDDELEEARSLAYQLYALGVDALIVQDMALTMMELPPIPLHASTQCDTTTPQEARLLEALGFEQIVLARELNVEQIRQIAKVTNRPLEVFVHGALCVSYSGRCYLSQALTNRSANRGACSQQCRLPYNLLDARGTLIGKDEHLLSPKDLNRTELIHSLLEAGVSSLKIEGRLKGISYVKNITAHYRQILDQIIKEHPEQYRRASYGHTVLNFIPNPIKSFNRGFTDYQFHLATPEHPNPSIINKHTPKSQGEYLGTISSSKGKELCINTSTPISNGDGMLCLTPQGEVLGFKINRNEGNKLYPAKSTQLPRGTQVWRNYDHKFEAQLSGTTAVRKHPIDIKLQLIDYHTLKLSFHIVDLPQLTALATLPNLKLDVAQKFDEGRIRAELSKLGETIFEARNITLDLNLQEGEKPFIPASWLTSLRRQAVELLLNSLKEYFIPLRSSHTTQMPRLDRKAIVSNLTAPSHWRTNISNTLARKHYQALGIEAPQDAYELSPKSNIPMITTKHCIKRELGYCIRETSKKFPYQEPLFLEQNGNRLRLEFDCRVCQMLLYQVP